MDRESMQERFGIIGTSPAIRHVLDRVRLVASTDITVLIEGESGVGKELFAGAVHELSTRRHKPMLTINCAAIPEGLIESELFGNEKGAYTGAVERRRGYFEEANGSTIFLDEIGEMPLPAQVRLLRVLETGEFSRVGSSSMLRSDVRVVAATNRNLGDEVTAGRFREDLYYRLSTVIITVPPLRDRKEDIQPIFESFQFKFSQRYNMPTRRLDASARELLQNYRWPGNARELRNLAEQTAVLMRTDVISADDIRPFLRGVSGSGTDAGLLPVRHTSRPAADPESRERGLIYGALLELRKEVAELKERIALLLTRSTGEWSGPRLQEKASSSSLTIRKEEGVDREDDDVEDVSYEIETGNDNDIAPQPLFDRSNGSEMALPSLEEAERRLIEEALKIFDGNRRQAAEALGISERTLYRKIKEFEHDEVGEKSA
jgi:transcriptional regulator with PAS, ATPase and Fis domain